MHSLDFNTTPKGESTSVANGSSSNSSSIAGPLQTLNSSLKRIRLNEGGHESIDSEQEQEWGALDLAELDESEQTLETDSPTRKKHRKESEDLERDDMEDMDDFMPSDGQSITKTAIDEERHVLTEKTNLDQNTASSCSSKVSMTSTAFKSQLNMTHKSKTSKPPKPVRSHNGMEDVFSHEQVRNWSEVRIKTWDNKRTNTEGFYYRFVGMYAVE
ncbi:hypothetical protein BGZ58_009007 [Dissophora ornata]|nr:hypothetical protein BGZ58_009007 [Dissophora ornata]